MPTRSRQRARQASSDAERSRALRSFLTIAGTGSAAAVLVPGRGEYGNTCTFVKPARSTARCVPEGRVVLGREAHDHVGREVEIRERLELRQHLPDPVAAPHLAEDAIVARLQRHVQVRRHCRRLAQRGDELGIDVVDLDRREPQTLDALDRTRLADEPRQGEARVAIAKATEVDAGEHDLTVPLSDAAADLGQYRRGAAAPGRPSHERNHAEGARERAAVLDLHERADAVEPVCGLDAPDRTDVTCDRVDDLLAALRDDHDIVGGGRQTHRQADSPRSR